MINLIIILQLGGPPHPEREGVGEGEWGGGGEFGGTGTWEETGDIYRGLPCHGPKLAQY